MKYSSLALRLLSLLLCPLATMAQSANPADTSLYLDGRLKIIYKEKEGAKKVDALEFSSEKAKSQKSKKRSKIEVAWGGFSIGFVNKIDNTDYSLLSPQLNQEQTFFNYLGGPYRAGDFALRAGKSVNLNFDIVKQQISIYKHYFSVVYGLSYEINSWSFRNPVSWRTSDEDRGGNLPGFYPGPFMTRDSVSYKKNKLVTNFIQVPLMLRFETNPGKEDKNFYVNIGGFAGYMVRSHTKQIQEGTSQKLKRFDDFILNNWQYGAMAEIGTHKIALYYKQSFSPWLLYGPRQYPMSFGVRLAGF